MSSPAADLLMLGGARLLRIPVAMLLLALLSRAIGPHGVGQWAMTIAIAVFFHSFFLTWTQAQAVRFGREEWQRSGRVADVWAARRPLVLLGLAVSVVLLVLQPFSFFARFSGLPESWWPLALAYLLGYWSMNEAQILFQTTGRFSRFGLLPLWIDAAVAAYIAAILVIAPAQMLAWCLGGMVAVSALVSAIAWVTAFVRTGCAGGSASRARSMQLVALGWPAALAFLFGYVSDWGDHFLLQHFHGPREVGLFQAGYQAMVAMMSMAAPLSVVLLPRMVDHATQDPEAEKRFLGRTVPLACTLAFLAVVPGIALVPWFFELVFGAAFREGMTPFLVLCIAVPGAVLTYLYSVLFNLQGRIGRNALYIGAMAATNMAVSLALVPRMGLMGAAIGSCVSFLVVQILYVADQHRRLSISMAAPLALFLATATFCVLQLAVGPDLPSRAALAAAFMCLLVLLGRGLGVADGHVLADAFPRGLRWLGGWADRVLAPSTSGRGG